MKEMGDIEGVFVGHDHDNDYAVRYSLGIRTLHRWKYGLQ